MAEKQPRKRVSQACVPCGIKRIKCDAALPSCGQCIKRGHDECTYGISKRNKRQKITVPPAFLQPAPFPLKDGSEASHRRDDQQSGPLIPIPNAAAVTPTVSARLFKNYFTIVHPMWPILYKPVYDLVDYENLAETLPTPLLYAIYAIAACVQLQPDHNNQKLSDTENFAPLPSPEVLFETALSALQRFDRGRSGYHPLNVLKPTIETCQALTILALQQHGVAEAASAALLCGMASAMAIEMHLHKAMSPDSDPTQVQVSSRLWWNIFVLDKMMACEMGRPVVLRSEETNTPFPSVTESDEYQLLPVKSTGTHRSTSIKTQTLSGFHTSIRISVIMEMVSRQIYSMSAREAIRNNPKSGEETRQRLWRELHEYHQMLDASPLRLDMKNSTIAAPVTITNMVAKWMWCTVILSNRPFVTYSEAPRISQVHETHPSSDPLEVCVMAANNTCLILERYAENMAAMSCDLIFPIFTSASILAHYSKRIGSEGIETQRRIDLCIRWLLILGKSWKSAEDRKKVLTQNLGLRRNNEHQHSEEPRESYQSASSIKDSTIGTGYVEDIPLSLPTASNTLVPPQPQNQEQGFVEDWAFLRNLGNTTDDFYTIDAEFREFLDREYEVDDIYGLF